MQFKLKQFHRDIPNGELLEDLKQAAKKMTAQGGTMSSRAYATAGRFSAGTFAVRFGSWNKALIAAGLEPSMEKNVSTDALFENLREVWVKKGEQPVFRDMSLLPSRFGTAVYVARFGSWRKALQAFVADVQSDSWIASDQVTITRSEQRNGSPNPKTKKTNRSVSERMRFRILMPSMWSEPAARSWS